MSTTHAADVLKRFVNPSQLRVLTDTCHGEEGPLFIDKMAELAELAALVETMPKT